MMLKKFIKAASALLFTSITVTTAQTVKAGGSCNAYPANATCSSYVNYSVFLPNNVGLATVETKLQPLVGLSELLGGVSPDCLDAFARYSCSMAYPKCVTANGTNPYVYTACASACAEVNTYCASIFTMAGKSDLLPNCSAVVSSTGYGLQPDDSCNIIYSQFSAAQLKAGLLNVSAIPEGFVMTECPAPFIKDPLAVAGSTATVDPTYCRFGCCIPCPAQNLFFKEGWAVKGFLATDIIRFVSAILSFILVVSYLVLPDKRRHPSLLILNMSIAIFIFNCVTFFSIGDPKKLQCAANAISPGEMGNNALCAAQGALLVFGSFATCIWCCALIVNLHVHTVWNSNFFSNRYILLNIICWGVPTLITCIAIGLHALKFEFGNLCLVSMKYIFPLFFYPLAGIVCPSFIIHIATFFYIAKIAVREGLESDMTQSLSTGTMTDRAPGVNHKHVIVAVKIQWRALLLAVVATVTVLFYWLFYMTQMSRMTQLQNDRELTVDWLQCMMIPGNNQNICYSTISIHLPPFALMLVAEILVSSIGIWLFIMFGKRSLWREWNDLIYDMRLSMSGKGRAEKHGEQFFAL